MAWWSLKDKFRKDKNKNDKRGGLQGYQGPNQVSVSAHIQQRNQVASEYSQAMDRLKKTLTPEDRYRNLVLTYRDGRDLMIVPESWMGRDQIVNCKCKKIYVDTPIPSIVRTR